jgi:hypothetical protein
VSVLYNIFEIRPLIGGMAYLIVFMPVYISERVWPERALAVHSPSPVIITGKLHTRLALVSRHKDSFCFGVSLFYQAILVRNKGSKAIARPPAGGYVRAFKSFHTAASGLGYII